MVQLHLLLLYCALRHLLSVFSCREEYWCSKARQKLFLKCSTVLCRAVLTWRHWCLKKTFLLLLLLLILFFITVIESQQFSTRCVKERIWHYFSLGLGTSFIHLVLALVLQLLVLRYLTLASALASTLTVASSFVALALVSIQSWPWP